MGYSFRTPTQNYLNKRDSIIAGSYLALGIVGSNPSVKMFDKLNVSIEQTKTILEAGNEAQIDSLSREKVLGDMFVTGVQAYYAKYISQSRIMSLKSRTMYHPIPMAGTFGYEPHQRTLFGLNRGIERHGLYMNVRTAQMITDRNGDSEKAKQLMLQVGMLSSALEHQVPEQMFIDPNSTAKPEGLSTAKALGTAIAQGQRIYTINQQNRATALPNLRLDAGAMAEINNALASGKEVTAHTDQLAIPGFRGSGYSITDPVTGEGVYKISGGKNGGVLAGVDCEGGGKSGCPNNVFSYALYVISLIAAGAAGGTLAALATIVAGALGGAIAICVLGSIVINALNNAKCEEARECILQYAAIALGAIVVTNGLGALFGVAGVVVGFITGFLAVGALGAVIAYLCPNICVRYED
jgi:hypothetical protein